MKLKTFFKAAALILSLIIMTSISYADTYENDNAWHFDVLPYLWALNMNGREQIGTVKVHVDQDFDDILRQLNWGAMVWLDAYKGKFGLYANILYADLSNSVNDGPASLDLTNKFGIFGVGASYEVWKRLFAQESSLALTPYLGLRHTINNSTAKLNVFNISLRRSDNQNWTDPLIGARLTYTITRAWLITLAGDIGGTNTSDHYSYDITGLLGYTPQTHFTNTTLYLGYRFLDQRYSTGSGSNYFNWDMKLFGPLIGLNIAIT